MNQDAETISCVSPAFETDVQALTFGLVLSICAETDEQSQAALKETTPLVAFMRPSAVEACKAIAASLVDEMRSDLRAGLMATDRDGALCTFEARSTRDAFLATTAGGQIPFDLDLLKVYLQRAKSVKF